VAVDIPAHAGQNGDGYRNIGGAHLGPQLYSVLSEGVPAKRQRAAPDERITKVKTMKRVKFIFTTPAGKEMKVLTMGKRREMNAAQSSQRANQSSAFSKSSCFTRMYLL
jgi:hypothetical protein